MSQQTQARSRFSGLLKKADRSNIVLQSSHLIPYKLMMSLLLQRFTLAGKRGRGDETPIWETSKNPANSENVRDSLERPECLQQLVLVLLSVETKTTLATR